MKTLTISIWLICICVLDWFFGNHVYHGEVARDGKRVTLKLKREKPFTNYLAGFAASGVASGVTGTSRFEVQLHETVGEYVYTLDDTIGRGAYGYVFRGQGSSGVTVAIKSVTKLQQVNLRPDEKTALMKLQKANHKNIVCLYDYVEDIHNVYFIMEYCNGRDLTLLLKRLRVFKEGDIKLLLLQLTDAFKVLIDLGIAHRDLKPGNILLSYPPVNAVEFSQITFKIADFGLARILEGGVMATTACGTPCYRAPEVLRASPVYDNRADLWSLGVTVVECLTGLVPFKANTVEELERLFSSDRGFKYEIPQTTSTELRDLIEGLLRPVENRTQFQALYNHRFLRC